jgi:hypothetical protein
MISALTRKLPSWMTGTGVISGQKLYYMPNNILDCVKEVVVMREELTDAELGWPSIDFLKEEVENMDMFSMKPFESDEGEIEVYNKFRASAVAVEEEIYNLMYGTGKFHPGPRMEEFKWVFYQDILEHVRDLSRVLASCESDDEKEETFYDAGEEMRSFYEKDSDEYGSCDDDPADMACGNGVWKKLL